MPERIKEAKSLIVDAPLGKSLTPGYTGYTATSEYAGLSQRWLVVTSEAAMERGYWTVQRHYEKGTKQELKAWCRLSQQAFACEIDTRNTLKKFEKSLKYLSLEEAQVIQQDDTFYLQSNPSSRSQEMQLKVIRKGRFILASNEQDTEHLSDQKLLETYKAQQQVERGFRFLKHPEFQASQLYLKSPKRVMALLMVMTLCLLVYTALEYRIRQGMKASKATFPSPDKRPLSSPTACRVLHYFEGIQELTISSKEGKDTMQVLVLNTNEHHWLIIQLLGERYHSYYT